MRVTISLQALFICFCVCVFACAILSLVLLCFNRHSIVIGINVRTPHALHCVVLGCSHAMKLYQNSIWFIVYALQDFTKLKDKFVYKNLMTNSSLQCSPRTKGGYTFTTTSVLYIFVSNRSLCMNCK